MLRNYFLAKLFIPLIKGKVSSRFEAIFGKLNFWWKFDRRGPTKLVKILYYLKLCLETIFWVNSLFHSSKERFLQNFRIFLENWIFDGNSTGADLTKIVKILYYLKLCSETTFLSKFFISLIKGKVSTKF